MRRGSRSVPTGRSYCTTTTKQPDIFQKETQHKQGLDLIEPAADMGFGAMARRPRGPQAHGNLKDWTSW